MYPKTFAQEDIIHYYDTCHVDYSIVWHVKTHYALHYGYWDQGITRLREALIRMNQVLASKINIQPNDKILDAGCGVGGSAIFLAKNYPCQVHGISLSEQQVAIAAQNAKDQQVEAHVSFSKADFTKMPFDDESFDIVWAVESVCHANEKNDFLQEAFRVLKKGGRLIVADFFRTIEHPNQEQDHLLQRWAHTWAVPSFEFVDAFQRKALANGFTQTQIENITTSILPSAKRLYYCFFPGLLCDGFLRLFGKRTKTHQANVWSTYYQYKALQKNLWNYYICQAVKE